MTGESRDLLGSEGLFTAIGGAATFDRIVARFYSVVATDPVLRPLYPEEDLEPARERLSLFLQQYWGGPRTYSDRRGHPRLRMRHAPFRIGIQERDAWLSAMRTAIADVPLTDAQHDRLWSYLVMAADSLVNVTPGN